MIEHPPVASYYLSWPGHLDSELAMGRIASVRPG